MQENLSMFLHGAAASLRDLAVRAPEIANELRRFADELEEAAERTCVPLEVYCLATLRRINQGLDGRRFPSCDPLEQRNT